MEPHLFALPTLAGRFLPPVPTWEALSNCRTLYYTYLVTTIPLSNVQYIIKFVRDFPGGVLAKQAPRVGASRFNAWSGSLDSVTHDEDGRFQVPQIKHGWATREINKNVKYVSGVKYILRGYFSLP